MKAILMILAIALLANAPLQAQTRDRVDQDVERLERDLRRLDDDQALSRLGAVERLQARQAIQAVREARASDREHRIYIADRRIETARAAAQAEQARDRVQELERERDRIVLDAARRDAELARREAERLRMQSLTRQEEALRALQERELSLQEAEAAMEQAEQSRRLADARGREASLARQEADLASAAADSLRRQLENLDSRSDARGEVMTLSGEVFAPGQAQLRAEAVANLDRVVEFVQGRPGSRILVEGHTDATGSANLNQSLSQQRAESVRRALIDQGVDASRIQATGYGQTRPVADNATEQGRSRNRRVDVILAD
ncbi:OmpA family protein [Alkalisalibacterium limincola]|uniref:OmpA family protein n=1 Tax=Alkalisalibacterium limincola TaxID=2699169 RepID=A0A5C8KKQ1_9GAMM|nr:OmpA family protein [Alkalisalibacterium limincola]TXK59846.1 OmpA family protein [Alkalisalibacterium limincola]